MPMGLIKWFCCFLTLWSSSPIFAQENAWSRVAGPLVGRSEVIGGVSHGCLVGAASLLLQGNGYQTMKPQRRRYFGHPVLIEFVKAMGQRAAQRGDHLLIGDLTQPRGGPMSYGHRSHQSGIDVDIWFWQPPSPINATQQAELSMVSFAQLGAAQVTSTWGRPQRDALFDAATDPRVERIFVNPVIKQHLCRTEREPRWLYKVRPWGGHDGHFHVRLHCPDDSPRCISQAPLNPREIGCDRDLDQWVTEIQQAILNPRTPRPSVPRPARPATPLPSECQAVLRGQLP